MTLFLLLAVIHHRTRSSPLLVLVLWNLVGVILHESAHLLAGILFRARPSRMTLLPRRTNHGWRLGSVSFTRINALNAVPVALAPLGLAAAAWLLAEKWFLWWKPSLQTTLGLYGCLFILLYNALPSSQDLRIACNPLSILLYGSLVLFLGWYLAGNLSNLIP